MRVHLVSLAALLALPAAAADQPRQPPLPAASDHKPVTVSVVDRKSGAPVTEFTYQARYDAPGLKSEPRRDEWTRVKSQDGTFEIKTPVACRLTVLAKSPDYIGGYPLSNEFVIKSSDGVRRVVVQLRRGITVKGTVRDAQTKGPIAGATVAPVIHELPIWVPDEDKQVKTGADGRYEVRGVDPELGVSASHPDYVHDLEFPDGKRTRPNHEIYLKRGVTIAVTVVDTDGKPLEGVTAGDLNHKKALSNKDGRLVFQNPDLGLGLTVHKEGFIDRTLDFEELRGLMAKGKGLVVALESLIALAGRVVGPDGRPVTAFTAAAGPGKLPSHSDSVRDDVKDREGRFELSLSKEGTTWVGVAAEGFAAWEGWVEVKRGGAPIEVRLGPGVDVSGRVEVADALRGRVKAKLVPRRDKSDIGGLPSEPLAEELPTRVSTLAADGSLRFEHVRPDRYRLVVEGKGVPETALALDVPDGGLDVGTIRIDVPAATGRIEGRVWHPKDQGGEPWAFAKGYVGGFRYQGLGDEKSIVFQADENGRFKVDHVPAGLTTVGFPFFVFDVLDSYTWSVLVVEGQTTPVRAFDPDGRREFALAFAIGDGSKEQYGSGTGLDAARKVDNVTVRPPMFSESEKAGVKPREPMFRVELRPLSKDPLSFAKPEWHELDAKRKVVLPDVGPGAYRLRLYDWLGWDGLDSGSLFDQEVVVPPGGQGEVRVELGGGCITGKIPAPTKNFERPVEVTAVAKGSRNPSRRTRCDDDGNFCVRYLSPGTYSLFIHDPNSGFCRVDDVKVMAGVVDIGEHPLAAGATVSGTIRFERPSRVPDEVVAIGPSGVSVRRAFEVYSSFDRIDIPTLWAGHWTISARSGDEVLASGELDVVGTGTHHMTLTARGGPKP